MPTPHTVSEALNERISEFLKHEGWSQREFARQLGVTQGAVSYLLGGKRRRAALDYYERLAGIFGVPLCLLIAEMEVRVALTNREEDPDLLRRVRSALRRLPEEQALSRRPIYEGERSHAIRRRPIPAAGPQRPLALAIQVYIDALWKYYDRISQLLEEAGAAGGSPDCSTPGGGTTRTGASPAPGDRREMVDASSGTNRVRRRNQLRERGRTGADDRKTG